MRAQSATDTLGEIKVQGKHNVTGLFKINEFSPGQKIAVIDSTVLQQYRMQSVASLLSQQLPVFIKVYSFNGLSTLSFRGASAAQSQVLWNGIPIQNSALGTADISTLPVMFMSRVSVVYGGGSALWGSGNVGGALLLESDAPVFDSGYHTLSLSADAGSFNQYAAGIDAAIGGKRWYISLKGLGQTAKNNFAFTDQDGTRQKTANSSLQSGSVMLHAVYKSGVHSTLGLSAWYQQYDREIPKALFEPYSVKKQDDGALRFLLDWNKKTPEGEWYARSSFMRDDIRYNDSAIQLNTNSIAYQYYQEVGYRRHFDKFGQLLVFMPVQISWMTDTNTIKEQDRVALSAAYDVEFFARRLNVTVNGRAENVNNNSILLPGADASFRLTDYLSLRANVQRSYRTPTLNELYYNPGGNPLLRPEQGWSEDAGYTLNITKGRWSLHHDLSVFTRDIHDWIIWLGGAIWTPHNIAEVHSRGIETENRLEYTINKWKLHLGVNSAYVVATTVSSYIQGDGSIGKQIPYTPRYNGQLNVGFTYSRLLVNYNHTYTGYRFTVSDESEFLDPYQTGNLQLMYSALLGTHPVQLTAQCNNIWNQQYTVIGYRPMPGINFLAGLRVTLL